MSNNPFTNNRFNFLDIDKKTISKKDKDKEKKNIVYESENNAFIKNPRRDNDRRDNDRRDNDRRDNDRRDTFKSKSKFREKDSKTPVEFIFQDEMFPDLVPSSNEYIENVSTNFKDTLNTVTIEDEFTGLKPGWIEIYKDKETKQMLITHAEITSYRIKINQLKYFENSPNYIMDKAINFVIANRNKYINYYDNMYGEGEYENKFVMPAIYGPEYDTEEEDCESYSESYDETEHSDVYDDY
jgi:hypothetical protein